MKHFSLIKFLLTTLVVILMINLTLAFKINSHVNGKNIKTNQTAVDSLINTSIDERLLVETDHDNKLNIITADSIWINGMVAAL